MLDDILLIISVTSLGLVADSPIPSDLVSADLPTSDLTFPIPFSSSGLSNCSNPCSSSFLPHISQTPLPKQIYSCCLLSISTSSSRLVPFSNLHPILVHCIYCLPLSSLTISSLPKDFANIFTSSIIANGFAGVSHNAISYNSNFLNSKAILPSFIIGSLSFEAPPIDNPAYSPLTTLSQILSYNVTPSFLYISPVILTVGTPSYSDFS